MSKPIAKVLIKMGQKTLESNPPQLVLASRSPRRHQLLQEMGLFFRPCPIKVSENIDENLKLGPAMEQITKNKACAAVSEYKLPKTQGILVLSADTLVVFQGEPLGQPENLDQAKVYLERLSGQKHEVWTSVSLFELDSEVWCHFLEKTEVVFKKLSPMQIGDYLATGESLGKAGGYAIQGGGKNFVKTLKGSWTNVVGLPVERLLRELQSLRPDLVEGISIEQIEGANWKF